jgi:IS5 family transposase
MTGQRGFFDLDERYAALSKAGDPLERLAAVIDFEAFRYWLQAALRRSDRSKGGRLMIRLMFKILVVQRFTDCRTIRRSSRSATGCRSCGS